MKFSGLKAIERLQNISVTYPIENGLITDWDAVEEIFLQILTDKQSKKHKNVIEYVSEDRGYERDLSEELSISLALSPI